MNSNKILKSPITKYIGVGLAGAVVATGITVAVMTGGHGTEVPTSQNKTNATSADIWQNMDTAPTGWSARSTSMETDPLKYHQDELFATNEKSTCSFNVGQSTLDPSEFEGVDYDYLTKQRVLSYGENRNAKNASLKLVDVKTSAGVVPFWASTFTIVEDVDGDGKDEEMKQIRLAHAYPEKANSENVMPITEINYSCNSVDEWSEKNFQELLDSLNLNITGDTPPAVPEAEIQDPNMDIPIDEMPEEKKP